MNASWNARAALLVAAGLAVVALARWQPARAGQEARPGRQGNPEAEQAIQKQAEAFIDAFHKGDAKAVAACWTADGDFTDQTGRLLQGRDAIQKAFRGYFADHKGLKLRINSNSLRFVTPDVAVEDGTTEVLGPDGEPPTRARYTNVLVRKDGNWYLSSVRESPFVPPTNYEHLRQLEWLIGEWVDEVEGAEVGRTAFTWSENQGFIVNTYSVTAKNVVLSGGTQWIGWDPLGKRFRSWTFDSMGGFGESTWAREGDKWVSKSTAVLQDGRKMAATNVVTRVDANTITSQGKDRTIDGKPIPDTKEVRMKRVKGPTPG